MGIFDLFGKETKTTQSRNIFESEKTEKQSERGPVSVFYPKSFEDVQNIIDILKLGKTAIVHLTELKNETAIRVIDLLSGAVYAINGGVYEMEKNIFMFSPSGVNVQK